jgi:hypothetical protein
MAQRRVPIIQAFTALLKALIVRLTKPIIVLLTLYAVLVIAFDTGRPFLNVGEHEVKRQGWPWRWYPIATLDFETDNDGKITKEPSGPAKKDGITKGDLIDLASVKPDRRIIHKFVFVAHDSSYSFRLLNGSQTFTVNAVDEKFTKAETITLVAAQVSAFLFVFLCWYLVWFYPAPQTWGLFLYSVWFNSGQYFFWYANLPEPWLIGFDVVQAFFQALGLTGFLGFALYFPHKDVKGWRGVLRPYLLGMAFVLFVFNVWGYMNFFAGWRTETPFRIYYYLTVAVYGLAVGLLWNTYSTRPQARPKVRWIMLGGVWGLLWWLLADAYETTGMLDRLADLLGRWLETWLESWGMTQQAILNLMYAQNATLPLAVLYTALRHRVMGLRFFVKRAVGFAVIFFASMAILHQLMGYIMHWKELEGLELPASLTLAVVLTWVHNPLHGIVERVLFRRWYHARQRLKEVAKQLRDDEDLDLSRVNRRLVQDIGDALGLKSAALFHRRDDDGPFMRQDVFRWPDGLMQKLPAEHSFVARGGSIKRLTSLAKDPLPLRDPDDEDEEGRETERDFPAPILAAPVVIRHRVSRLFLLGRDADFDPDEVGVIREVTQAAAVAYRWLDAEARLRELEAMRPPVP